MNSLWVQPEGNWPRSGTPGLGAPGCLGALPPGGLGPGQWAAWPPLLDLWVPGPGHHPHTATLLCVHAPCLFCLFRATSAAYGGSQARGGIGAVATGLHYSLSHAGSKLPLRPTPQLTAMPDNPLIKARDRTCVLKDASQICFRSATAGTALQPFPSPHTPPSVQRPHWFWALGGASSSGHNPLLGAKSSLPLSLWSTDPQPRGPSLPQPWPCSAHCWDAPARPSLSQPFNHQCPLQGVSAPTQLPTALSCRLQASPALPSQHGVILNVPVMPGKSLSQGGGQETRRQCRSCRSRDLNEGGR